MKSKSKVFIKAVEKSIVQIALLHMFILLIYSVMTGDFTYLNLLSILDIQFFLPEIEYTVFLGIIGAALILALIYLNYRMIQSRYRESE